MREGSGFNISGGTLVVTRDLYWEIEKEFDAVCERFVDSDEDELTLDLTDVEFIFSPYMSRIVRLYGAAKDRGKRLRVLISPKLRELFDMAGLIGELNVEVVED